MAEQEKLTFMGKAREKPLATSLLALAFTGILGRGAVDSVNHVTGNDKDKVKSEITVEDERSTRSNDEEVKILTSEEIDALPIGLDLSEDEPQKRNVNIGKPKAPKQMDLTDKEIALRAYAESKSTSVAGEVSADDLESAPPPLAAQTRARKGELFEEIRHHIWQDAPVRHGVYEDAKNIRRYTELGLSMDHLKLMGLTVKDKASGAMIWSEKAKVHEALSISYDDYVKDWKTYADDARNAFIDNAQYHIESLNNLHLQKVWNNVVQAEGVDQYLGAKGYNIDGKNYTMDGITILALSRFHSVKDTKKFLESRDRENPILSEVMAATIKKFNGMEHDLTLEKIHRLKSAKPAKKTNAIATIISEYGTEVPVIDKEVKYRNPELPKYAFASTQVAKSVRESGDNIQSNKDNNKRFKGQMQQGYLHSEKNKEGEVTHPGYLTKYNDEFNLNSTIEDFYKSSEMQVEIDRIYTKDQMQQAANLGLEKYLGYPVNANMVLLEYTKHSRSEGKQLLLPADGFLNRASVDTMMVEGKELWGIQEGAIYDIGGNRLAKVAGVGTISYPISILGLANAMHLGGAGNIARFLKDGVDFKDGLGTSVVEYLAMGEYFARNGIEAEVLNDEHVLFAKDKNGKLEKRFETNEVGAPLLEKMKSKKMQNSLLKKYDRAEYFESKDKSQAYQEADVEKSSQASWHSRVGQMPNKEKRQQGIS